MSTKRATALKNFCSQTAIESRWRETKLTRSKTPNDSDQT
jgi:hypothetical protein